MKEELKIPNHVAIILDGNGRWAKKQGKRRSYGHLKGFENLQDLANYIFDQGVKVLSVYAFSTENFKRSKEEVDFLMNLFSNQFKKGFTNLMNRGVKLVFSGNKTAPLPQKVIDTMNKLEEESKNNTKGIFNVCLNYGGQQELIDTTKKIAKMVQGNEISIDDIDKDLLEENLYQPLPPIDLLIRTSGEQRVSNFMLWQLAYAEFYFPETLFPDFDAKEFDKAILAFNKRDRRFGGIDYTK